MDITQNHIREYRTAKGWSLEQLAQACLSSKSQISKLEKGHRRLTVDWMVRIGSALEIDPRDLLIAPPQTQNKLQIKNTTKQDTLPILKTSLKTAGNFTISTKIDQTEKPQFLSHTQDAYAVYAIGNKMVPMYRDGQLLLINPHKPPTSGCGIIVTKKNNISLICAFKKHEKNKLFVTQFSPNTQDHLISETDISAIHTIVSTIDP